MQWTTVGRQILDPFFLIPRSIDMWALTGSLTNARESVLEAEARRAAFLVSRRAAEISDDLINRSA